MFQACEDAADEADTVLVTVGIELNNKDVLTRSLYESSETHILPALAHCNRELQRQVRIHIFLDWS
jgi:hypothetical protein